MRLLRIRHISSVRYGNYFILHAIISLHTGHSVCRGMKTEGDGGNDLNGVYSDVFRGHNDTLIRITRMMIIKLFRQ